VPADFISKPPYNVIQPGAYSAVDASQLASPNPLAGRPIPAIVGTAFGGQPLTALFFRSPGQLRQVLRSGIAYDAARFAFDGGAPQVCVVRVGNGITQASLALAGSGGTVVTLTAQDWGSWANSVTITVATGPIITLTYTDQLGNTFTETWNLTGVGGLTAAQVAQAINGALYGYNASNFVTAVTGAGMLPLTTISATPLAGGTDGQAPISGDWTNGFQALEAKDVDIVVPATGDATIHAQALTHCQNMSLPNARKERVMVCGAVLGESTAQQVTRIGNLRSARAQLVYPGMQDYNANGVLTLYDPFYVAAKVAGMHCAIPDVATSLCHQQAPIVNVETLLSTIQGGAIDTLLYAGVTPIAPAPRSGFWIVDSLTGYNLDQTFRDLHKTRSADYVAQYARASLESQFVGSKLLTSTQNAIGQAANQIMSTLQGLQIVTQYKNAVVTQGQNVNSWAVGLPVMLVETNKFIFITVQLQPSATVSNTGSLTSTDALA